MPLNTPRSAFLSLSQLALFALASVLGLCCRPVFAATDWPVSALKTRPVFAATATSITLAVTQTSSGSAVTTATPGTEITLTATVKAGSTSVTPGQVYFCDASATYCSDIHIIGRAMLTSAGTATYRFYPGAGAHQYKAYFLGTSTYTTSTSGSSSLTVMGSSTTATATTIAQSGSTGNYTLTATVTGSLLAYPTGTVSFLDTNHSNAVLATATAALVPPTYTTKGPYTSQVNPSAIGVGDFNGDGIPDLAISNSCSTTTTNGYCSYGPIVILLGNGDGTFRAGTTVQALDALDDITVADFNGDGILDLAVEGQDNVHMAPNEYEQVFLGNGDGTFQAPKNYNLGLENPYYQTAGDFNNDGKLDLAIGCSENGHACILLGNGDGTFHAGTDPTDGQNTQQAVSGDFDGDGNLDLVVGVGDDNNAAEVELLKGKGDGSFTSWGTVVLPGSGPSVGWITVADVNGDGKQDLLIADVINNKVYTYLGNGAGGFTVVGSGTSVGTDPYYIAVADFNGDGKLDMAVVNYGDGSSAGSVTTYMGVGNGTFTTGSAALTTGVAPYYLAIGDFNKDGRPDIANVNNADNTVNIFLDTGAVSIATATGVNPAGTGTHTVDASYPGDSYNTASTSGTTSLTGTAPAAPTANSQSVTVAYNTATAITLTGSTPNNGYSLTYTVSASPSHGTLSGIPPNLTYTPAAGYSGSDSFKFYDNDGAGGGNSSVATVTITVSSAVLAPTLGESFTISPVAPGSRSAVVFALNNPSANTVALTGVAFNDNLPANLLVYTTPGVSSTCGGTVSASAGGSLISLSGATLASGAACMVSVNVYSNVSGSYPNPTGAVTASNASSAGNTASATLVVSSARGITIISPTIHLSEPLNGGPNAYITATFAYTGTVAPTGAVTMLVNGSSANISGLTCTAKSQHTSCTAMYSAAGVPNGTYPLTVTQAADANYVAVTGTGFVTIVP